MMKTEQKTQWQPVDKVGHIQPGLYVCARDEYDESIIVCKREAGAWWFDDEPANDDVAMVLCLGTVPISIPVVPSESVRHS
jgi:hypothetical protein